MATNLEKRYADYFGGDSLVAQQLMNHYNNESAAKQMEFQEYMSSSAHTREVADLLNAGLNPVLSANAGAPAGAGAYANIDSSTSAQAFARKMNRESLQAQIIMNKYATDSAARVGRYQAQVGAAATRAAAGIAAAASMYGADQARGSALDVANANNAQRSREQSYSWSHPTTAEGLAVYSGMKGFADLKTQAKLKGSSGRGYTFTD